ncbi:Chaperone protein DnaK [Sinobacterium norvegicum]|uniref:Chaperone protein DnaK n=1 Tax=Sinobacterium norvegicum TaxID=1641715 RepID=A0ABN8EJP6_9GAMM|nr:molecular chaperone [Sinobacterium norvegicum]CAH0991898.1 Chaperone protein DnaK [Sinobacterium norvegicum]
MISGFDYGTSNCAIGVITPQQQVELLAIEQGQPFMPSALYALEREFISEFVGQQIANKETQQAFIQRRGATLAMAQQLRQREGIGATEQTLFVGRDGFEQYIAEPEEGYFIKSPKSFLGASGLRPEFVDFFEDIVCAMMLSVKQRAEAISQQAITHTVIGRPVNFQGLNADKSNQQAQQILTAAAQRAGFQSVEFLYEPIAAGLSYETKLEKNKTVLVVDIGGGTTDCAMVRMGPDYRHKQDRKADFLGHSGERIGGNDLDIQLAGKHLMPLFGMQSMLKNGLPMPTQTFWNAVSTNDVGAQSAFNSQQTSQQLQQLMRDTIEPHLLARFIDLRDEKQNHHLVRSAEQAKIALSDHHQTNVDLSYIESAMSHTVNDQDFTEAIQRPMAKMVALMDEAISQAGVQPELIFITGGSAKSPMIRQAIEQRLGQIDIVDGDHFGSVAAGLTVWAQKIFK